MEDLNFGNYPHTYKIAAETLLLNLSQEKTFSVQKNIFNDFCERFSVVPILWKEWIQKEYNASRKALVEGPNFNFECTKIMEKLYVESNKHFYIDADVFEHEQQELLKRPYRKILSFPDFDRLSCWIDTYRLRHVVLLEQVLVIPHSKLNETLALYEHRCDAPLNATLLKQHNDAKKLYAELVAAKTDFEWLQLLIKAKDDDFIVENIEYRISQDPCNRETWLFYFDYFEKLGDIRILDLYKRYCRLFIEDSESQKNYAKNIEYFQKDGYNVEIWINDLKSFYEYFGITGEILHLSPVKYNVSPLKFIKPPKRISATENNEEILFGDEIIYKECSGFFNPDNQFTQEFSLPKTIMHHIITNNHSVISYRKLLQTCKCFFAQKQVVPVWHMDVTWNTDDYFHQNSMYLGYIEEEMQVIGEGKPPISFSNEIWLEHSISVYGEFRFLNKIYQSDIKYLRLAVDISTYQYDILVKNERIREIELSNIRITTTQNNEEDITLEGLMKWLPNAYKISFMLKSMMITASSSKILSQLKRNVKIQEFFINQATEKLEPDAFCKFIQRNITSESSFAIIYKRLVNDNYQDTIKTTVANIIETFQEMERPKIQICF